MAIIAKKLILFTQILSEEHSIHTASELWKEPAIFNETEIELNIPECGIELEDGWVIYPVSAPVVTVTITINIHSMSHQ